MVFPWLVIGASAALESARRNTPKTASERQVRKLKDVEHNLRERQKQLASSLEEAVTGLAVERESHEGDKQRLMDMSAHIQEIENRMVELQEMTDGLISENEQLKVEKSLLEEEARYAQKENQELRQETQLLRLQNTELEDKIVKLARESELEVARVTELLEELKSEVSGAVASFTQGGTAIEFQGRMEKLGIKLDCNLEDLKQISQSEPARVALEDAVTTQFNNQMGLVMEDRSRLEHLMGIAQNLRIKGGRVESPRVASREAQPFDKPARLPLQSDAKTINGMGMGGGILGALKLSNSYSQEGNALPEAGSIIPTAADVAPMLAEQAAVEKKMETLQVATPEEPTVSGPEAVGSEPVPKAQKNPLFKLRFKGLGDQKKSKAGGMPSMGSLQGDDSALPSSELILK